MFDKYLEDCELFTTFPDMTFFSVHTITSLGIELDYLVGTLENSLSMGKVGPILSGIIDSIDYWSHFQSKPPERHFNKHGLIFAESRKLYRIKDIEELKEDYYIAKLSGLTQ